MILLYLILCVFVVLTVSNIVLIAANRRLTVRCDKILNAVRVASNPHGLKAGGKN